jgi:hypothetical protein
VLPPPPTSSRHFVEKRIRFFQVGRIEAFAASASAPTDVPSSDEVSSLKIS